MTLDASVLIALGDAGHVHEAAALRVFERKAVPGGWATCYMTENAFLRILSHPSYPRTLGTPPALAFAAYCRSVQPQWLSFDDIRIEDYRHLSSGVLKATRACRRSSAHIRASSEESSVVVSVRASSAPVQLVAAVGTNRATGTAESRTTKVVCSRRARATHSAKPGLAFSSAMVFSFAG